MSSLETVIASTSEIINMVNWPAIGSIILPNVGGWVNSVYFAGQSHAVEGKSWYDNLKKAPWNPPKWVFGPVWTVLYSSMGYASYLVWEDCGGFNESSALPLSLYGTQLAVNLAWAPIFFGMKDFKLTLIDLGVLGVAATATTISFVHHNRTAAVLMLPYLGWLVYANSLAYYIWKNNPKPDPRVTEIKDEKSQ